jgi:hypothetical protein
VWSTAGEEFAVSACTPGAGAAHERFLSPGRVGEARGGRDEPRRYEILQPTALGGVGIAHAIARRVPGRLSLRAEDRTRLRIPLVLVALVFVDALGTEERAADQSGR